MAISKKGFYFTILGILIVTVLFVAFVPLSGNLKDKTPSVRSRVTVADDFVETLKTSYVPMALRTSSYNALNGLSELAKVNKQLFADSAELQAIFADAMMTGSVACPDGGGIKELETCICDIDPGCADPNTITFMRGRDFKSRMADIETTAEQHLQLTTEIGDSSWQVSDWNVKLYQNSDTGAFQAGVNITLKFAVAGGISRWDDTVEIQEIFSFEGIEDPLYSVKTQQPPIDSLYTNKFRAANLTHWNLTNTWLAINGQNYSYNAKGASFLARFTEADEPSECCGIESLINADAMPLPPITEGVMDATYSDWCYFGSRCPPDTDGELWYLTCISRQTGKFKGFAFDTAHLSSYNLSRPDQEGRTLFYQGMYADDPNDDAQCANMMQIICNEAGAPYPCS